MFKYFENVLIYLKRKAVAQLMQCDEWMVVTLPRLEKSASLAGNQSNRKNVRNLMFQV